jgi:hypothetical protein
MLFWASYKDSKILVRKQVVELKRGQLCGSISYFMKAWETTKEQVIDFLKLLQSEGMIEKKTDKNITTITICNYESYQGGIGRNSDNLSDRDFECESEDTSDYNPDRNPDTNKEIKEVKEYIYSSNQYAREEILGWDMERENGYASTFKGQGTAIPLAKKIGKTPREVMNLLEIYMAHREVKNRGHKDYNEFLNLFMWHIENKKITIPEDAPKAQTQPKVITGQDIFSIYK